MKKLVLILSACLVFGLTGCVSTKNTSIPRDRLAQASGSTLAITSRPVPAFVPFRPSQAVLGGLGGAIGGAIGGIAAANAGNDLMKKHGMDDPAVPLARELAAHLATSHGVVIPEGAPVAVDSVDLTEIATAAAGKADLLLDVQTVNWSCIYLPTKWTRYRVMYSVKLRFIDVKKKQLIAEGFFAWQTPDGPGFPTYDELFADNAALLRRQLDEARATAAKHFTTQILVGK